MGLNGNPFLLFMFNEMGFPAFSRVGFCTGGRVEQDSFLNFIA